MAVKLFLIITAMNGSKILQNITLKNFMAGNKSVLTISCLFAAGIAFISSSIIYAIIILSLICLIYFRGESILLGLTIVMYLAAPSEYFGEARVFINVFVTGLLIYLVIKKYGLRLKEYPKIPNEIIVFILILLVTLLISTVFSSHPVDGFFAIARTIIFFIIFYMFYLLIVVKSIYTIIFSLIIVCFLYGIRMMLDFINFGPQDYFIKSQFAGTLTIYGSDGYTYFTVFFISISLLASLLFLKKDRGKLEKIFLISLLFSNILIIILSSSRGGIVAAFLSISFILFMRKKSLLLKFMVIVLIIISSIYLFIPSVQQSVDLYLRWEQVSTREIFWNSGVDVIKDHPVFGIGTDTFNKHFTTYAPSSVNDLVEYFGLRFGRAHPHNLFLHYWAENGIMGFFIPVIFFIYFFIFAFRCIRNSKRINQEFYMISVGITGIGIGMFIKAFLEVPGILYYGFITTDLPIWLLIGVLIFIYQKVIILQ